MASPAPEGPTMRLAVLIITLCLTGIIGLQSLLVFAGGEVGSDETMSEGGAVGVIIALLFVVAAGFVMALPLASMGAFIVAAIAGLAVGATTPYVDLGIWGGAAAVLAVMSFLGSRELNRHRAPESTSPAPGSRSNGQAPRGAPPRSETTVQARDVIADIERLARLRESGTISADEYETAKSRLL